MNSKQCARCGLYKPPSAFNRCLEHADRLSHWCLACDKRNAKRGYGNQAVSWPLGVTLPHRETQCQVCKVEWRFDTDREGCMVQICKCGMVYVPIKVAPKVLRKVPGKRIVADASGQRKATPSDVRGRRWTFDPWDLAPGR